MSVIVDTLLTSEVWVGANAYHGISLWDVE